MPITLKDVILVAQTNLRDLESKGLSLTGPLRMLSRVLSSLPEGGEEPLRLAREACEAITDCAYHIDDAGYTNAAVRLHRASFIARRMVARLLRELQ